jgi:hypothetical protein
MIVEAHDQVAGLLGHKRSHRMRSGPEHVDPPSGDLDHEQHIQPFEEYVSTVKKSTASTPLAWARRNCRQVRADRLGAGSTPARWRIAHTVLAPSLYLSRHSSPWTRR